MTMFANVKVGRKMAIVWGGAALQIAGIAAWSIWVVTGASAAAERARHYGDQLNVMLRIQAALPDLEAHMSHIAAARDPNPDTTRVAELRKDYRAALAYQAAGGDRRREGGRAGLPPGSRQGGATRGLAKPAGSRTGHERRLRQGVLRLDEGVESSGMWRSSAHAAE